MAEFSVGDTNCILAYEFQDNSNDLSGEGHNGTLNGTAAYATDGINSKCVTLDGNSDYVETADTATLDVTGTITLAAWVKRNSGDTTGERGIISKGGVYNLICYDNGKARVEIDIGGGIRALRSDNVVVTTGTWFHVAGTYDGSDMHLYINGVEVAPSPDPYTGAIATNNDSVRVGIHSGGYWHGEIDRAFIFNVAKSKSDILAEYDAFQATFEQEGFRFRADDGNESGATWLATQDTDITRALETNTRIRLLVNVTLDPSSKQFQLEYRKNNGSWRRVPASGDYSAELTTGGTASASHENQPSEGSDEAFDDSSSTKWLAFNTAPRLQYRFGSAATHKVTKYAITSGNDDNTRDPKDFTLQGSNDGSSWTTVDTVTGEAFATRGLRKEFVCDTPGSTAYEYYRLNISLNNGNGSITQLAELQLYKDLQEDIMLASSSNITASGENTTVQLSAPSGKTTGDFVVGRIQDDENPADLIDITNDDYTEVEWCIVAKNNAINTDVMDFRVTSSGVVLSVYSVTPQWTIGAGSSGVLFVKRIFQNQAINRSNNH